MLVLKPAGWSAAALVALAGMLRLSGPAQAQSESEWTQTHSTAAELAVRYGTAQDAITPDAAQALLLELVNAERTQRGLEQLQPQALAAETAQEHAREMAERRYASHYSLAGQKCEARYNARGGTDQISENYSYYEIGAPVYLTPQLVRRLHAHWMASASHRRNLLQPHAGYLGSAVIVMRDSGTTTVTAVEELVTVCGEHAALPAKAMRGAVLDVRGTVDRQQGELRYIGLGREALPYIRDAAYQNSHLGGYRPPALRQVWLPEQAHDPPLPAEVSTQPLLAFDVTTGRYSLALQLPPDESGAFYITVWVSPPGTPDEVYCASTQVVCVR